MKPVTRLYAVLVALTLVGLFVWSGADWYQNRVEAERFVQTQLRQAAGVVAEASIRQQATAARLAAVLADLGQDRRWRVVLLTSERGVEAYRGPRPALPLDQAVPRWAAQPLTDLTVQVPVFLATGRPLTLDVLYEFYGRNEIFSLLRAASFTLVFLVLATVALVWWTARRPEPESEFEANDTPPAPEPALDTDLPEFDETVGTIPVETDEYWFDESLTLDDLPPLDDVPTPEAPAKSLYSPTTGLGWGEFLVPRLDQELQRFASLNQDLTLVVFQWEDEPPQEAWGAALRETFVSADLNFEHARGAAVVLPGVGLEPALATVRAVLSAWNDRGWTVRAGVASRSGRLLGAATLVSEAESALRRAATAGVPVVGLRTDPDRYREHLASQAHL